MKMNRYWWLPLATLLLSNACSNKKNTYGEVRDEGLTIQYARIAADTGGTKTFRVRVIPSPAVIDQLDKEAKVNLIYRMDSCFYTDGKTAVYPAIVQPVATGSGKVFEYLVAFDSLAEETTGTRIIYHDRYLNKKTYQLIVQPQ